MNDTILAVIGYISWSMLILLALAMYRTTLVLGHKHNIKFKADGSDVSEFGLRLTRTLANCFESFAFIGGVMLLALATGAQAITDPLALWLLAARVGQSVVHLISISAVAIYIRFALFLVQFAICAYWLVMLGQRFS